MQFGLSVHRACTRKVGVANPLVSGVDWPSWDISPNNIKTWWIFVVKIGQLVLSSARNPLPLRNLKSALYSLRYVAITLKWPILWWCTVPLHERLPTKGTLNVPNPEAAEEEGLVALNCCLMWQVTLYSMIA